MFIIFFVSFALSIFIVVSADPLATVKIKGDTYKYQKLVGKGFFPSDARDQFGDTAGGWGSAIAADVKSWKQNKDGSYEGIIYTVPDRGWNTNGKRPSSRA
jgi:hypothetical protein